MRRGWLALSLFFLVLNPALAQTRAWLRQLPPEVADKIAFRNAERLFGGDARR